MIQQNVALTFVGYLQMKRHAIATDLNLAQDILLNIEVGQNKRKRPSQGRGITENALLKNHRANSSQMGNNCES